MAVVVALLAFGGNAFADNFPSHPVTIVVPFSAGGPSDAMARILAERMQRTLGQTIMIENVTGAGGSLGVGRVVRAPADGYTVGFGHLGTNVANGAIYNLGYDLVTDLEPVVLLPSNPMIIVSKNAVPAKTLKELLAWLKAKPTPPTAGTAGAGSGSHIATSSPDRSISSSIRPPIPSARCAPVRSVPMPSLPTSASNRRRTFRPRMRPACPDFT
jgi:tripartite-type tricarboxylate transporter receptor subunit TctC